MTGRVTRQSQRIKDANGSQRAPKEESSPAETPTPQAKAKPKAGHRNGVCKVDLKVDMKPAAKKDTRKSESVTPKRARKSSTSKVLKESAISKELDEAMAALRKSEEDRKRISLDDIKQLKVDFSKAINKAKRETQERELRLSAKPSKSTRSGLKRGATRTHHEYTEGKYINIGMNAVGDTFDADELEYLRKEVTKVKEVKDLKFEHLKYLIHYVIHDELKGIQKGEVSSDFHDRYNELRGESKKELQSEIRTSLFTNEQSDYINGYLQELFDGTKKGPDGGIQHDNISYIETVLLYETVVRIVKRVHNFESFEQTLAFMKVKSREAYGISEDEDDSD